MSDGTLEQAPVLVVGANGQLGSEFVSDLVQRGARVIAACREPGRADVVMDLSQPEHAAQQVEDLRPSLVINAAAYTAVDRAEEEGPIARRVNADGPAALAAACHRTGALLVHFSTDYVFDGTLERAYRETDDPRPLNEYGRGKLLGERAVTSSGAAHLIFRTSGLYTPGGQNFVATMLRLFRKPKPVGVVNDQFLSPTCARHLASAVAGFVVSLDAGAVRDLRGLYHLGAAGEATWYDFAKAIHELASPPAIAPLHTITSEDFGAPARRPARSTLDCGLARQRLGLSLPHWREQLEAVMPEFNQRAASLDYS